MLPPRKQAKLAGRLKTRSTPCLRPYRGHRDRIHIGKNSFDFVAMMPRAPSLRQKWARGQVEARLAHISPCLIGMKACVGVHHLNRKLALLGPHARQ